MEQMIINILLGVSVLALAVTNILNTRMVFRQGRELRSTALHIAEREKWEDETLERHDRRIQTVTDEVCSLTDGRNEKYAELHGKLEDLDKRMKDFDELAAENIRAQTESEKAWAAGLQSLANFGTGIPSLNVENLNHE